MYWDINDCRKSLYCLWFYRKKFYDINTWDKRVQFYTISKLGQEDDWMHYHNHGLEFCKNNLNEDKMKKIYLAIVDYKPVWMLLQPSIAELLYIVKEKYNLPNLPTLKYVEMTGEMLTNSLKKKIQQSFQCAVANQYGMNEVNSIAYECPQGKFHCMEENVLVEILDDKGNSCVEGQEGNIYVTTYHNYSMPFIRYGTGDRGSIHSNACKCGCKGKILNLLGGRKNDWVYISPEEKVTP